MKAWWLAALGLLALAATSEAVTPCEPAPDVSAVVAFTTSSGAIQDRLADGGKVNYTVAAWNYSAASQRLGLQVFIRGTRGGQPIDFFQFEAIPTIGPGKNYTTPRALTIPPDIGELCVRVVVTNQNAECGTTDLRSFQMLADSEQCVAQDPPVCVASSTCGTHTKCWDHQPSFAEVLAWTQANCF